MGNCTFCGESAGLFRHHHQKCFEEHDIGKRTILNLIQEAKSQSAPQENLANKIDEICRALSISEPQCHLICSDAWSSAVDDSLQDGLLSEEAEKRLIDIKSQLSLMTSELQQTDAWHQLVKSAVLRDVMNGVVPKRMTTDQPLPFNLQKGEEIVWLFADCDYLEDVTRRHYVGGSHGVSVRVMKGVYYRVGAFKGQAIDQTERVHQDTGLVAITNKNIYFHGNKKSLRVAYEKIISFEPFNDGIGFVRHTTTAKHQFLITHDGWFAYNLVTNVARL